MTNNKTEEGQSDKNKSKPFIINSVALIFLQIANYVFPFLLIPYLTRVLGASLYGVIAFGLSMVQIAAILTDYGFNMSATYSISRQREDKDYLNKMIGSVFVWKTILLGAVIILLAIYLLFENKYVAYHTFLWLMMLAIVGQTYQPIWFFQGIEKMMYITMYTIVARLIYLVLTVVLVTSATDFYWVALANGIGYIASAIVGVVLIYRLGYKFVLPEWSFLKASFIHSTGFFWSRAAVATYTACGTFYLGLVSTPLQVAYYAAAEQLYRGGQSLFNPISQALYPHMAKHKNFPLFFRVMKWTIALSILGIIAGIIIGPQFIRLLYGPQFKDSYPILLLFIVIFGVTTPSILLGYPFLGALGQTGLANRSVIFAGILQVIILTFFYIVKWNQAFTVAISALIVETVVLVIRIRWARQLYKPSLMNG